MMGRTFKYFPPPPPPACKELDWMDLPRSKLYLVTKLEPIEINDMVVHCGDDGLIIVGCPWDVVRKLKMVLTVKIEQKHRRVHIVKNANLSRGPEFTIYCFNDGLVL